MFYCAVFIKQTLSIVCKSDKMLSEAVVAKSAEIIVIKWIIEEFDYN